MATDSTELTFVRCPSCRSLVPAVSTRCRMCGASLESGEDLAGEDSEDSSSRVRQRTMSKPKSQLSSAVNKIREEFDAIDSSEESGVEASSEKKSDQEEEFEDPLGDYIGGVDQSNVQDDSSEDDDEDQQLAEDDIDDDEASEQDDHKQESLKAERKDEGDNLDADKNLKNGSSQSEHSSKKPKVIIESGAKKGSGLSFGRSKPSKGEQSRDTKRESASADKESGDRSKQQEAKGSRPQPSAPQRSEREEAKPSPEPVKAKESQATPSREAKETGGASERSSKVAGSSKSARMSKNLDHDGRLFGWLVSYSNPDGEAIELRQGKFFVTSSSLKDSDLVIDDDSVSTPHAVVTVSGEKGLQVQDLMSEGGVFVRQRENDVYRREEEIVEVGHGDWVRFGDVEFLITLIAHVGVK